MENGISCKPARVCLFSTELPRPVGRLLFIVLGAEYLGPKRLKVAYLAPKLFLHTAFSTRSRKPCGPVCPRPASR